MSEPAPTVDAAPATSRRTVRDLVASTEIDTRLLGMMAALAVIWTGFHIMSDGKFITSRNLWNLSVQSTSIAIMATGMVLIIVTRNIDLSVGALLGFLGYTMALVQTDGRISIFGANLTIDALTENAWYTWLVALAVGLVLGALIGGLQGYIVAYVGVPAFIVTLGGFLAWRGLIFRTGGKQGQTLAPLDDTFRYLGGAPDRSLGAGWSWVVALLACAGIVASIVLARQRRRRHGLAMRSTGVDVGLAVLGCGAVILGVWLITIEYASPITGDPVGIAYPVLILIGITLLMSYLARRRRFGRYVYAYGGNPEAAELGGINTRKTVTYTYVVMGMLCAVSAAIQTARLNSATTNLGVQNELDVIAAAVIGGTSFSGGIGTIPGAVLGAVVMQSLRSGMSLLNIDSPSQDIVVGVVLVTAVAIDALLRQRRRSAMIGALAVGAFIAAVVIQTGRP
ncbi:sugar ABC transporter permease [Ilumatobacter sp.]|uniref:sugar ABC transporter permease n=1 Tax=Ilumatobacter sp. TaxID=1967498 RepID=UPI003AF45376